MKIMVIDGPNMNLLGKREPQLYGQASLEQIQINLKENAKSMSQDFKIELSFFQSNLEGELVDKIQECLGTVDGIMINAAAYTHTSIAIRDAIMAVGLPCVELHMSNTARREDFRQKSLLTAVCVGSVSGFGPFSYHLALMALVQTIGQMKNMQNLQGE